MGVARTTTVEFVFPRIGITKICATPPPADAMKAEKRLRPAVVLSKKFTVVFVPLEFDAVRDVMYALRLAVAPRMLMGTVGPETTVVPHVSSGCE